MDSLLKIFMIIGDWLLFMTVRIYQIWCVIFYLRLMHLIMKWSSLFVIPVNENNNCAIDWSRILATTFSVYLFSLYYISKDKYFKYSLNQIRIIVMVYLYPMHVGKDNNTKCVLNPFSWSIWNDCYAFIEACVMNRVPLFEKVNPIEVIWVW